jgi:hypothetical protein
MTWALVMMFMGTTPIPTGLTYDTLSDCYKAENQVAAEYAKFYNDWLAWAKTHQKESGYPPAPAFITNRVMRGVCVPHGNSN